MTLLDVYLEADFTDAAERVATKRYLLRQKLDTTANTGHGNYDAVATAANDTITAINVLTWDAVNQTRLLITPAAGSDTPNIAANNQVTAFTRIFTAADEKAAIEVPAWDDEIYDEDNQNLIDPVYQTAVAVLALLLRDPETGHNYALVPQYSQSRTRKSRNVIND